MITRVLNLCNGSPWHFLPRGYAQSGLVPGNLIGDITPIKNFS